MLLPKSVDDRLSSLIDAHARHGLVPCQYVISYFQIRECMIEFYSTIDAKVSTILEIGGRTYPHRGFLPTQMQGCYYEDRARYVRYFKEMHPELIMLTQSEMENCLSKVDVVVVHANYIAECVEEAAVLASISAFLNSKQKFFLITYEWDDFGLLSRMGSNGELLNCNFYHQWFDENRSHMHLGCEVMNFGVLKIFDLSYFY